MKLKFEIKKTSDSSVIYIELDGGSVCGLLEGLAQNIIRETTANLIKFNQKNQEIMGLIYRNPASAAKIMHHLADNITMIEIEDFKEKHCNYLFFSTAIIDFLKTQTLEFQAEYRAMAEEFRSTLDLIFKFLRTPDILVNSDYKNITTLKKTLSDLAVINGKTLDEEEKTQLTLQFLEEFSCDAFLLASSKEENIMLQLAMEEEKIEMQKREEESKRAIEERLAQERARMEEIIAKEKAAIEERVMQEVARRLSQAPATHLHLPSVDISVGEGLATATAPTETEDAANEHGKRPQNFEVTGATAKPLVEKRQRSAE